MKIVTTHKGTDFDALASLVAATVIYPGIIPVLPNYINPNLKAFLSIHKDLFDLYSPGEIELDEVKTLVVVDTNSWDRLDGMKKLKSRHDLEIILWDHHARGDIMADELNHDNVGANCTLMVKEIERKRKIITPIQASLFLMGIYEDTGNMTFPSTKADDARAVAYLLQRKADLHILSKFLRHAYGKKQKDILFKMIQNARRLETKGFTISIAGMSIKGHVPNLALVVQMYREIINVDAAFGIFTDAVRDRTMVIGRSDLDEINIGAIMKGMGGGGHPGAGSALLKSTDPAVIEQMIIDMINGDQQTSVILRDIMSYPVITVNEDTSANEVAMKLRECGCTGLPVVNSNDGIVGVISRRDFKKIKKTKQMQSPVKAFMSRDVVSIDHDKNAIDAAKLMIKNDIGRIPVMKDDKIIGIVTRSDVMLYFYDLLPD